MNEELKLFDTHTHYDDEAYEKDRDSLLDEILSAPQNGVAGFIAIGCSLKRSILACKLSKKYDNTYAAVGIHPDDTKGLPCDYLEQLKNLAKNNKVVAIGEIGLDYFYDGYNAEEQKRVFCEQLSLAAQLNLPVVIHSRDATADTIEIIQKYKPKAVMHCFSGSAETAKILINLGIYISFTGVLTFKNAKKSVEACKAIPLDRLMLETDCPYLAPTPFRGKRCDSRMAWYTAQKIAQIKCMTTDEVVEVCNNNAKIFFGINF